MFSPNQAQRYLNLSDKLWKAIPEVTGKKFESHHAPHRSTLKDLEDLRNDIIHCKNMGTKIAAYDYIFKRLLEFDFLVSLKAVRDLINFYMPDYVEQCDCGKDF